MAEKTEKPTARQLRKARQQGDVAVSAALSQAVAFAAGLAVVPAAAHALVAVSGELVRQSLRGAALSPHELAWTVALLSLPVIVVAGAAAALLAFAQSGGLIAPQRVAPDLSRLNPIAGLRALVTLPRLLGLLRALVALALVTWFGYVVLRSAVPSLANTPGELERAFALAASTTLRLAWYAAAVGLALGALDLLAVRHAWLERWKMTRDEVRREFRESEGDPEIKAQRRRAHQEVLVSASIHAVKEASVVIVNPTHLATALRYEESEDAAPRVLAQGQGDVARRILEAAHAYGVPVVRDVPVARALAELEVGDEIPEALYEAVAEILRELWDAEKRPDAT